ncbi:MAG: MmgE/PrpD family protein [Thermodesulfobacteriota bacterium]|nr:MmgE/PrpD family protein [Thermodesulfobacteriota bacterium]
MKEMSISERLADFIDDLSYKDLTKDIRELVKLRFLDALSCAISGRDLSHSMVALQIAKRTSGDSTLIGHKEKTDLFDAIMANTVMIHSIVQDDILSGLVHPGSTVVSTALGVGEQEGSSGEEVLTAAIIGYELIGRIMRANGRFAVSSFRPSPIFTTFGAAATAGKLMRLKKQELASAIGYASSLAPGTTNEVWWSGTMEAMFQAGMSARVGLLCAIFAQSGATASSQALEGKDGFFRCWGGEQAKAEQALDNLGKDFVISRIRIKAFPVCGANQRPIQMAEPLAQHKLKANEIKKIVERIPLGATNYAGLDYKGPFKTQFQALISMQFCVAATVLGRPVNSPTFFAKNFNDPEVEELAKIVELIEEEGRSMPCIEVHTVDGYIYTTDEEIPDKNKYIPTRENMTDKFRVLCTDFFGDKDTDQLIDLIMDMDKLDDIKELMDRISAHA